MHTDDAAAAESSSSCQPDTQERVSACASQSDIQERVSGVRVSQIYKKVCVCVPVRGLKTSHEY
jgi:hypothetical protein